MDERKPCAARAEASQDLRKLLESDFPGTGSALPSPTTSSRSWSLTSVAGQGPLLRFLSRSYAGFLVLPAFLALVALSCCVSAGHMTAYACSVGELADLKLASSLHSLEFLPWWLGSQKLFVRMGECKS